MQFQKQSPDNQVKAGLLIFFILLLIGDLFVVLTLFNQRKEAPPPMPKLDLFLPMIQKDNVGGNSEQISSPTSFPVPTELPAPTAQTYTVKPGDTTSKIAKQFGITVDELVAANNINDKNLIYAGEILIIPTQTSSPPSPSPQPALSPTPKG
jgi:LysM repeat protein